jgi:hypothetical protein
MQAINAFLRAERLDQPSVGQVLESLKRCSISHGSSAVMEAEGSSFWISFFEIAVKPGILAFRLSTGPGGVFNHLCDLPILSASLGI